LIFRPPRVAPTLSSSRSERIEGEVRIEGLVCVYL